ncbi:aldo/keto reductase [Candidatus Bipolaricaulota bacterium]|nr:aldo/keto reductase [Candidatus Bipolaricaulota bacterium]
MKGEECRNAVRNAIEIGYRHIDTAVFYGNEEEVGEAISSFRREDLFVTTKIWKDKLEYSDFKKSTEGSLKRLKTDYVDLVLIHWPNPEIPLGETIRAMNELVEEGKTRHIGVSNFSIEQLEEVQGLSEHPIITDQVKYHVGMDRSSLTNYCRENDVSLTAYSPLGQGKLLGNDRLKKLASNYGKTPGQLALKWLIDQEKVIAIPKASTKDHMRENLDLFDWELREKDKKELDDLVINT